MAAWTNLWIEKADNFRDHLSIGLSKTRLNIDDLWPETVEDQIAYAQVYLPSVNMMISTLPPSTDPIYDEELLRLAMDMARPNGYADVVTNIMDDTTPEWRHKVIRYISFFWDMISNTN